MDPAPAALVPVLFKFADGSYAKVKLPPEKLAWAEEVRQAHGDEAYRACLRGLATEYRVVKAPEPP